MKFTQEFFERVNSFNSLKAGFKAIAAETGYVPNSICKLYYKYKKDNNINYCYQKEKINKITKITIEEVSKCPNNIRKALQNASKKANLSYYRIKDLYYKNIRNNPDYSIFTIVGKKSGHFNIKNNINNKYPKYKTNNNFVEKTWSKIKNLFNNILK